MPKKYNTEKLDILFKNVHKKYYQFAKLYDDYRMKKHKCESSIRGYGDLCYDEIFNGYECIAYGVSLPSKYQGINVIQHIDGMFKYLTHTQDGELYYYIILPKTKNTDNIIKEFIENENKELNNENNI